MSSFSEVVERRATREEIDRTEFHVWYPELKDFTFRSEIIRLGSDFVSFIKEDGFVIPPHLGDNYSSNWDSSDDEDGEVTTANPAQRDQSNWFVELDREFQRCLQRLGGHAFLKTNWSAPLDVPWMTMGSLKVTSLRDIYLQLKSSDRVMFDFEHMYDYCEDGGSSEPSCPIVVLRKWVNLLPSMELRLFIRNGQLVGICQRDCSSYYPFMGSKFPSMVELAQSFFTASLPGTALPDNYCMDIYIDRNDQIWVVDVNCFGLPSSSLLFDWEELFAATSCLTKYVQSEGEKLQNALGTKRGPIDVHMAPDFSNFMDICKQQQEDSSSDEDSET